MPRSPKEDPPRPAPWWGRPEFLIALASLLTAIFGAVNANRAANTSENNGKDIQHLSKSVYQTPNKTANIIMGKPPEEL